MQVPGHQLPVRHEALPCVLRCLFVVILRRLRGRKARLRFMTRAIVSTLQSILIAQDLLGFVFFRGGLG